MSLGQILRKARESRKLTASQVAAATHMKVQTVEAIEKEDFSSMPAAIYCKGFIKLYAEYLGIDPDPLAREYVERFVAPPPPPPEEITEDPESFSMQTRKDEDLPPIVQDLDEDHAGLDLFSYGKTRTEEPPENLFDHNAMEKTEDMAPPSVRDSISQLSSRLKNAASTLSGKLNEHTARFKESIKISRPEPGPAEEELQHKVDTSPITLPHRKILIISGAIAGIVLVIFLISVIARFLSDGTETIPLEQTEQELILPARLPPPYID